MVDQESHALTLASKEIGHSLWQVRLSVPSMHCAGCMAKVERSLMGCKGVVRARVNLTGKFVDVDWKSGQDDALAVQQDHDAIRKPALAAPLLLSAVEHSGHQAHIFEDLEKQKDDVFSQLIRALAVAGFASSNIMLLSVAVWSGAEGGLKEVFHYLSMVIALPALLYSGRLFFQSAFMALRQKTTNMDVPISIGVLLAFSMSFYDTIWGKKEVYFEASVMLLFFLLIGRTLDHMMREKARHALSGLKALIPGGAYVKQQEKWVFTPLDTIEKGMCVRVSHDERVPLDGTVSYGASALDCALVTGESVPQKVQQGAQVLAGMLNLGNDIHVVVTAEKEDSFLSKTVQLMEQAASSKSSHQGLADRMIRYYAPFVHGAAFIGFLVWMMFTMGDWHQSITIAIAVLIITCPCALGLAVPMVHVVAARILFDHGVLMRSGSALERMEEVDAVLFDKTGTLTTGNPVLQKGQNIKREHIIYAASLALHSSHPYARSLVAYAREIGGEFLHIENIREIAGFGLEGEIDGQIWRFGRIDWALSSAIHKDRPIDDGNLSQTVLSCEGKKYAEFYFDDILRPTAQKMIKNLKKQNMFMKLISGDGQGAVEKIARQLGMSAYSANAVPQDKLIAIEALTEKGHKVLMVGDGLNDAPALSLAHVSMAPSTAADIGRGAADFVFLNGDLTAVNKTMILAQKAQKVIRQNFALATVYNVIALPLAFLGMVNPMVAAIAMSLSSIIVVLNALRLNFWAKASIGA